MTTKSSVRDEAVAAVLATMGPDHVAACVSDREVAAAMGVLSEVSSSTGDLRYGRRGGHRVPPLRAGEAPYGVIDGKRQPCDPAVYARCSRSCPRWWVTRSLLGRPCDVCGVDLERVDPGSDPEGAAA